VVAAVDVQVFVPRSATPFFRLVKVIAMHFAQAHRRRSVSDLRPPYSTTTPHFYNKNIMELLPAY
jgi:hypothetical protein